MNRLRWSVVALAMVLSGCSAAAAPTPVTHVVAGSITLTGTSDSIRVDTPQCHGFGGYSDMAQGAAVVVKDQAGVVIAAGALGAGVFDAQSPTKLICRFPFTILGVPDAPFLSIEVGHRGALTYSREDLAARGWSVDLTLGG